MSGFSFHAAAPGGEWLNDPNGLAYRKGRYELYAQHSVDGPNGDDVGWARLVSDDLLRWDWDGIAIAPAAAGSAYSGCVLAGSSSLEAYYTRHDPRGPWQTQHRTVGWNGESSALGPEGRNCRDPFVFRCEATGDWRMLVAEPCDWCDWAARRSRLELWASRDRAEWRQIGEIGPWHPPGVMWEVPVVIDFRVTQALILSLVDRRDDGVECSVRYWLGQFGRDGFRIDSAFPQTGLLLDHGPDFYAAIPNLAEGWPTTERVLVAWASNWRDARSRSFPGGGRGGPITLPRQVELKGGRLRQRPIASARGLEAAIGEFGATLELAGLTLSADRNRGRLTVSGQQRERCEDVDWVGPTSCYTLFEDGGLYELFIAPEGITVTAYRADASGPR